MYNNEYNQSILDDFVFIYFFYSGQGYKLLQRMEKKDFLDFYYVIKDNIIYNSRSHVFTDNIKSEIFKCLNLYRQEICDKEFLDNINNDISMLNLSTSENSNKFYKSQLFLHFDKVISYRHLLTILSDKDKYEEEVKKCMISDFYLVNDLFNNNVELWEFIKKWALHDYPIITINYLLKCYPKIFQQIEVSEKIRGLLYYNNLIINDSKVRAEFKNEIEKTDIILFDKATSKILKQIKKLEKR